MRFDMGANGASSSRQIFGWAFFFVCYRNRRGPFVPWGSCPARRLPFKNGDPNMAPPGFGSLSGVLRIRPLNKIRPGVGPGFCVRMVGHARGASLPGWAVRHGMRQCVALYPRAVCMGLSCMLSAVQRHAKRTTMGSSAGRLATLNGTRLGCSARGLQRTLLVRPP